MDSPPAAITFKNHRFPVEIISHTVWLYFRFCLSFRDVEELLLERGAVVTYEAIGKWCRKFGQQYANQLRAAPAAPRVDQARERTGVGKKTFMLLWAHSLESQERAGSLLH